MFRHFFIGAIACSFLLCISNCSILRNCNGMGIENGTQNASLIQYAKRGEEICMKDLGCFKFTNDFFHPIYRPFNFLPYDRRTINTKFHLYTRRNPKEYINLSVENLNSISDSPINPQHATKFIIHGFIDNRYYGKWMEELKDHLLLHGEYNIFIVDWSGGNSPPYTQAVGNTLVVGAEIALMIKTIQKMKNISPMDCHVIGHSLGSHIAGYAGKYLQIGRLGRITAVDPAEPFFQNMPPTVRVDRSDADFVDAIHTDAQTILLLGLGMSQPVGHVDFYPNDGRHQPGCKTDVIRSIFMEGLLDATRRFVACNHQRAVDFFTYSINYRNAIPVSYECPSWGDYTAGRCADCGKNGTKCAIMGIRADEYKPFKDDSRSLKFYVSTSGSAPFWLYQYQVMVKLSKPKKKFYDQEGKLSVVLHGSSKSHKVELNSESVKLYHGSTYTFLITTKENLGKIQSLTFSWWNASWNIFKTKTIHLDYMKVIPMNIINKGNKNSCETIYKDKPDNPIQSGSLISLMPNC